MSQAEVTAITRLHFLPFPAFLVAELNGGHKQAEEPRKYFATHESWTKAKCPFAGGCADMSARECQSGLCRVSANLRLPNNRLTVRVDNDHRRYHLDVEINHKKVEKSTPITLDPARTELIAAFDVARRELLKRASQLLPTFGSAEQPTLDMLRKLWEVKFLANSHEIHLLLPPYPGDRFSCRFYTPSDLPFRLESAGVSLKVEPFEWHNHTTQYKKV